MDIEKAEAIIEAMLFSTGSIITIKDIMNIVELGSEDIERIMQKMRIKYDANNSGIELIKVEDGYQLCTKKEYYDYIYPLFDNRAKPSISNAALETLSIIAYNPKITRSEIDAIRGVNSDGTIYKLLEYDLIEESGRLDAPGRPTMYKVTKNFMKMFGISSLDDLPELPRYKLDENEQIVIEDVLEDKQANDSLELESDNADDVLETASEESNNDSIDDEKKNLNENIDKIQNTVSESNQENNEEDKKEKNEHNDTEAPTPI